MIEMLGVLAIIGVLSAGGIMGYSSAMENYRVNKHFSDLKQMVMNAKTVFNKIPTKNSSLSRKTLNNAGILVADYPKSKSVWNTYVGIVLSENTLCQVNSGLNIYVDGDFPCTFVYTHIKGISESVCRKILTFNLENFFEGFGALVATKMLNYRKKPFSEAEAVAECKRFNTDPDNYIVWRFIWNARFLDRPN